VIARALQNSTHSLAQQVTLLEAQQVLAQAKANKGIQVQLNSELAMNQTSSSFKGAYRNMRDNEIVGLSVQLPIFDWGVSKGRVKMAQADLEVTKTQLDQAHEEYLQSLRTSVVQFNSQAEQCKNAQRAQDIAEERYNIMKMRFEAGGVAVTDLNTAQQEKENARASYLNQLKTYWNKYYSLRKSTLYDWIRNRDLGADFDEIVN
jgi:outer membrane protein TolC